MQRLPTKWEEREGLRRKGQFWTPDWVSDAMVAYVMAGGANHVFDPAVGAGAFFRAAKRHPRGKKVTLLGTELDSAALEEARTTGLSSEDLARVEIGDFLDGQVRGPFGAIVANPPYIRHHRMPASQKSHLRSLAASAIGQPLDLRAGLHIYFLVHALQSLAPGGRLAFIMPADTCEGVFARSLWRWIGSRFAIDGAAVFDAEATPFPGVDTNPVIFLLRAGQPRNELLWARCRKAGTQALHRWTAAARLRASSTPDLNVQRRDLKEALESGLSRAPASRKTNGVPLRHVARVVRGIATGANEFFFMTRAKARELGIDGKWFVRAIGRTRDVPGSEVTEALLEELDSAGRPTFLLNLDGTPEERLPAAIRRYLDQGRRMGLPGRALISTRRPWYRMERREPPPFLFAYLGRRQVRFIRNRADVVPLTGFLAVYPTDASSRGLSVLGRIVSNRRFLEGLARVGKSYGGGAIKVEPRALEHAEVPKVVAARTSRRV